MNLNELDIISRPYAKIGKLEVERDWLKKIKNGRTMKELLGYVSENKKLSIRAQCEYRFLEIFNYTLFHTFLLKNQLS